jgi:sigma-B regulation protein RsbU (phosphoserine phosphatase)
VGGESRVLVAISRAGATLAERWARAETAVDAPSLGDFTRTIFGRHTIVLLVALVVVGALALGAGRYLCARLTSPLADLVGSMERVSEGDLSHRAERRSKDEFGFLVDSFNSMVTSIERLNEETRETERMKKELEMGRQIQLRLLPQELPSLDGYDVFGANVTSLEVSGDYYDILPWGGGKETALVVGDVSGKGLPAALVMSSVRSWLHAEALRPAGGPAEWMARLNQLLYEGTEVPTFLTFFLALLSPDDGRLTYVNAGHNPPILVRGRGESVELERGGPIAGVFPSAEFELGEVELASGDLLVMYTDGITEATRDDEEFEPKRLRELLFEIRGGSAQEVAEHVFGAVREFTGRHQQDDDMTLVVLKVLA